MVLQAFLPDTAQGYLLDTNVASWACDAYKMERHTSIREWLETIPSELVFISSITLGEVEYGLQTAPNIDASRQKAVRDALDQYMVLPVDSHTRAYYAPIRSYLFEHFAPRSGRDQRKSKRVEDLVENTTAKVLGIDENDLWIVAVCVQHNLSFVTGDQKTGMRRIIEAAAATCSYQEPVVFWPSS